MKTNELSNTFQISEDKALRVIDIINGDLDPSSLDDVQDMINRCYGMPNKLYCKLIAINELIAGFGVEYIESNEDSYTNQLGVSYINTGDTYSSTIAFDHHTGQFSLTTYGDTVESDPSRFK